MRRRDSSRYGAAALFTRSRLASSCSAYVRSMSGQPAHSTACSQSTRSEGLATTWAAPPSSACPSFTSALHVRGGEETAEATVLRSGVVVSEEHEVVTVGDGMRGNGPNQRAGQHEDGSE